MKRKLILIFCIVALTPAAANAQTPQKTPPPPEVKQLAAQIAAYATAQCGGKGADDALDCRAKVLWAATQCPDRMTDTPTDAAKSDNSGRCVVSEPGFEYEVSSVKPHNKDVAGGFSSMGGTGDGYRATNVPMKNFVINAFLTNLKLEVTGAPSWTDDTQYDIEGKYTREVAVALKKLSSDDSMFVQHYMMRQLLKNRMNFAAHVETKEVAAYDLVVGKNGPKMKACDPNSKENTSQRMGNDHGKTVLTAKGMLMASLAVVLMNPTGRPVIDKTGLTDKYDVTLEFAREQNLTASVPGDSPSGSAVVTPPDPIGPSLQAALEDQLGLKLVPSRGLMQILVVDHIDKPGAN